MAKLKNKTNAGLAILFVLVGVALRQSWSEDSAWNEASISSCVSVNDAVMISSNGGDGKVILDGVILSSTIFNASGYVEFRDSDTANTSLTGNGQSGANVVVFASAAVSGTTANPGAQEAVFIFPRPIRFLQGLSANASGCAAGAKTTPCYTVLYRDTRP